MPAMTAGVLKTTLFGKEYLKSRPVGAYIHYHMWVTLYYFENLGTTSRWQPNQREALHSLAVFRRMYLRGRS